MLAESFKVFDPTTTKWRFFNFFCEIERKPHFKLRKYQKFVLIELHSLSEGQLADWIFKLWKSCVCDYQVVEHTFFEILTFNFPNFQTTFVKNFRKKPPGFKIDFESTDKVLLLHLCLWSEISRQWNNASLNFFFFFWNLHGRVFCFLNFVKWRKYKRLNFAYTSKMYCCGLF